MTEPSQGQDTTHFGFKTVGVKEKQQKVAAVFDSVAGSYDVMNDLMSLGVHRLWKRFALELVNARPGQNILDLASGTGDLARSLSRAVGNTGSVIACDINGSMLSEGRRRLVDAGVVGNVRYVQANAESLPFPDDSLNAATFAFGLRNVTHKEQALAECYRVLQPGGRLLVLEFSHVSLPVLKQVYDTYSFRVLPLLGRLVARDADSYRYLAESIRMHPDQETLKGMFQDAGFEQVDYFNLTGGIVAVHRGFKF